MHHNAVFKSYYLITPLVLNILLLESAQAAIQHPLNELKVIEVPISKQDLTRIAVKDDRIQNVFGSTGEYVLEADEDQGQVFIRPSGVNDFKPIHLTFTTESGHTQDLRLIPQDQDPEALILQAEDQEKKLSHPFIARHEVEDLLRACREQRIPLGYKLMPLALRVNIPKISLWAHPGLGSPGPGSPGLDPGPRDQDPNSSLKAPKNSYFLIREIKGNKLRGLTYEIKNTNKASLVLSESEFAESLPLKKTDIIAILMPTKTLDHGERTEAHVVAYAY
ncbi:MAG: hypothetical protein BGO67_10530 [Alphaproteobacteria bacterium 41-28]|nr:MAG: hypothetical protein BGO67_10530 [Alphaproteobacteria bacterium 41-28]